MNKLLPTTERVFMSLVGPGGSGKGTFLHKLVTTSTAVPFHTFFYQRYQPTYDNLNNAVEQANEFIQGVTFEQMLFIATAYQKRRLLFFDDFLKNC